MGQDIWIMVLGLVVAQFTLPRRLAFAPLLIAICHFQNVPVIEVGGAFPRPNS